MSTADDRTDASPAAAGFGVGAASSDGRRAASGNAAASGAEVPAGGAAAPSPAAAGSALVFDDPLDRPSPDDSDRGWGGSSSDGFDDDFTRFINEKPPHHL
jgi:acetyl-CoA synthetase